ncbi:MAG TPA: hypothetical protein VHU92_02630 [Streptosporangiaceae bacterium]|jgi:heme-degrading monooxygenase HmoA|nr:hypothetical protein [Streptosporangiaceae bacterium]
MPAIFTIPWRWTRRPRPETAVLFASRFDSAGPRAGIRLFTGGIWLWLAVLRAPGALGAAVRACPLAGRYYTVSLWRDEASLRSFAHARAHRGAVRGLAGRGPIRGVLVATPADPRRRPHWQETLSWLANAEPGPYQFIDHAAELRPAG